MAESSGETVKLMFVLLDIGSPADAEISVIGARLGTSIREVWLNYARTNTVAASTPNAVQIFSAAPVHVGARVDDQYYETVCVAGLRVWDKDTVNDTNAQYVVKIVTSEIPRVIYGAIKHWRRMMWAHESPDSVGDVKNAIMAKGTKFELVTVPVKNIEAWKCLDTTFPNDVAFRFEDKQALRALEARQASGRMCVVGSPGVGKSTLVTWCVLSRRLGRGRDDVLLVRKGSREGAPSFCLISKTKTTVFGSMRWLQFLQLMALLICIEGRDFTPYVVLDGFEDQDLVMFPYWDILVTSIHIDPEYGASLVIVPSWTLPQVQALGHPLASEIREKRYANYGGDLRAIFASDIGEAERNLSDALDSALESVAYTLLSPFGRTTEKQIDRLRRYTIADREELEHYWNSHYWFGQVESVNALHALRTRVPRHDIDRMYRMAKKPGGASHGIAFELKMQFLVMRRDPFELNSINLLSRDQTRISLESTGLVDSLGTQLPFARSFLDRLPNVVEILVSFDTSKPIWEGESHQLGRDSMVKIPKGKASYWMPVVSNFPYIDAVARCELTIEGQQNKLEAFAMLQFTVGAKKVINGPEVKNLAETLAKARCDVDIPVVLVFVRPHVVDLPAHLAVDLGLCPIPVFTGRLKAASE